MFCNVIWYKDFLYQNFTKVFIDKKYKGAQNSDYIAAPTIENFEKITLGHNDVIAQMTYAVEKADVSFTEYLVKNGVVAAVGHSNAQFKDVIEHSKYGLSKVTHLHNASSPHHHRKPGVVTAGLYSDELYVEMIADGVHLHFDVLKTVFKIKGSDKIILVTDSLSAKNMPDGDYELGGQAMVKKGNELRLLSGSLAGSIMPMSGCVKNMLSHTSASWMDVVRMTSLNAAKQLMIDDKVGVLQAGYVADLVVLDEECNVLDTYCKGIKAVKAQ
jgi:N-acetylglucosamine-6-phosphate deacetylase